MMRKPTTDVALVVLHWTAVGSLFVSLLSGVRIAADSPDATFSRWIAAASLQGDVYWLHAVSGLVLLAVAAGYYAYLRLTRLTRRFVLPRERIQAAIAQGGKRAWQVRNIQIYFVIFGLIAWLGISGGLLYLDADLPAGLIGYWFTNLHFIAAWTLIVMVAAHVAAQFTFGAVGRGTRLAVKAGVSWLLKMLRPRLGPGLGRDAAART